MGNPKVETVKRLAFVCDECGAKMYVVYWPKGARRDWKPDCCPECGSTSIRLKLVEPSEMTEAWIRWAQRRIKGRKG